MSGSAVEGILDRIDIWLVTCNDTYISITAVRELFHGDNASGKFKAVYKILIVHGNSFQP
jgi:hypothetical protein